MFIDKAKIHIKAGNGGNGIVAWRREKFEPSGGPYGGDGGNGGDVILKTDEGIRTLMDFRYKRKYHGQNGEDGRTKRQFGKAGEDIIIKVPVGTIVKDEPTGKVIVDLKENNQEFIIAKGGRGGRGNARFATATRQAPGFAEPGTKGRERNIILELKLLADVGLIGFPNVGKSTFLSLVSSAKPKIANYHFTTLKPNLGVVRIGDEKSFVIADIPGLIEGASEGVGLGHEFLRHIERTRVLVHILDVSGIEGRDPVEDYYTIMEELVGYNPKLKDKPQIIVGNKMDIPGAEEGLQKLKEEFKDKEIYAMSAATTKGVEELKYIIWDVLSNTKVEYESFDDEMYEETYEEREIIVKKENEEYIVDGLEIERLLESIYFDNVDSVRYFQETLRKMGIVEKLEELGIKEGETVLIAGYEFEFFH